MFQRTYYTNQIYESIDIVAITVLIGARQVGKTTIMEGLSLGKAKVILYGQSDSDSNLFSQLILIEQYLKTNLNPEMDGFLLIDEFQYIKDISVTLKVLTDKHKKLKVIVTGSSSVDIIQKVEESLAGRVRMIDVYSLSFEEYLMFKDEELHREFLKYDISTQSEVINPAIKDYLKQYLIYGGLPKVALAKKTRQKIDILNDIYKTYLMRDVKQFVELKESVAFNKLLRFLAAQTANLTNINELSKLTRIPYAKVEEYIYLLEQMYIIKALEPYHSNRKGTILKMNKTFFFDLGMRNLIYNSFNDIDIRVDNGALFENFVYLEILKSLRPYNINFFRTKDGAEVDFVVDDPFHKISFEAKYRELDKEINTRSIKNFNKEHGFDESYLINLDLNKSGKDDIRYLPAHLIAKIGL